MDNSSVMGILDLIMLAGGVYILYGWYLLQFKNEIKQGVLIPKDLDPGRCRNVEGFKKYMGPRTLIIAICAIISGCIGLYQDYVALIPAAAYWAFFGLFFAAIIWFTVATRKAQKLFF